MFRKMSLARFIIARALGAGPTKVGDYFTYPMNPR
jgi:hypothetical protein